MILKYGSDYNINEIVTTNLFQYDGALIFISQNNQTNSDHFKNFIYFICYLITVTDNSV